MRRSRASIAALRRPRPRVGPLQPLAGDAANGVKVACPSDIVDKLRRSSPFASLDAPPLRPPVDAVTRLPRQKSSNKTQLPRRQWRPAVARPTIARTSRPCRRPSPFLVTSLGAVVGVPTSTSMAIDVTARNARYTAPSVGLASTARPTAARPLPAAVVQQCEGTARSILSKNSFALVLVDESEL